MVGEVVVRVNDRGPFVGTRIIDLSKRTAEVLDFKNKGKAEVRVQYIGPAPLDDNGSHLMAMNKELERGTPMRKMIASADRRNGRHRRMPSRLRPPGRRRPGSRQRNSRPMRRRSRWPRPRWRPKQSTRTRTSCSSGRLRTMTMPSRPATSFATVWPVQFIEMSGSAGPVYRVRLGPIASSEDAETALESAVASGFPDSHVMRNQAMQAALQ